ncbi:hypothetical protein [Simplicispira suum]|uniref:Flagellar biosynthesis protein n=1 Tax=Simplicispira suum TaxID=2109915 RepID=A0A2S0N0D4_9BURK|nr:hypothetical protein [Simplicispira suum]AVO41586.1 hypothetical protein C6571_10050 [Simplicispira suum]
MLEFGLHQGTSLYGRTPQDGLRLIPVAGTPGGMGLQVLWDICTHLQALGYPTVVLDGSERETSEAPGLLELLDDTLWIEPPAQLPGADSLAVLPAARGLAELASRRAGAPQALLALQPLLRRYAVVLLYAPMAMLASPLLEGSSASPLVLLGDDGKAVINSYQQLKLLSFHTGLMGTVARLVHGDEERAAAQQQLRVLCDCAAKHLGRAPRSLLLHANRPADLQRLALELLENAETLCASGLFAALPSPNEAQRATPLATSH